MNGYVPLADVAAACGIPAFTIQTQHQPASWAIPRDFRLIPPRYICLVAVASLPQLVEQLKSDGLRVAADRLENWRTALPAEAAHQEFTARYSATPREPSGLWFKKGQFE
jgi:hypothetical protein